MNKFQKSAVCAGLAAALFATAPAAWSAPHVTAATVQDVAAKLDELVARWEKAHQEFQDAYRSAKTNDERKAAMDRQPKPADHLPGFIGLAESAPGTETAAKAWIWSVKLAAQGKDVQSLGVAFEALLRDHAASKDLAELANYGRPIQDALGAEKAEALLREVVAKVTEPAVKGGFLYALASLIDESNPAPGSERAQEVRNLMESVAKDFANVKDPRGRSIGKRAEGWLFEKANLVVGKVAPEIEGSDLSGVAFKLSDYRGKVVLLDFWGNW